MDRRVFLRRVAGAGVALWSLDGATLERVVAEPKQQALLFTENETFLVTSPVSSWQELLRDCYKPALVEQLNRPQILLNELHADRQQQMAVVPLRLR